MTMDQAPAPQPEHDSAVSHPAFPAEYNHYTTCEPNPLGAWWDLIWLVLLMVGLVSIIFAPRGLREILGSLGFGCSCPCLIPGQAVVKSPPTNPTSLLACLLHVPMDLSQLQPCNTFPCFCSHLHSLPLQPSTKNCRA